MPNQLPPRPNLEHLRKLAKDLLHAHHAGEPAALAKVAHALPQLAARSVPLRLSQAQAVLAREYGFATWPRLVAHVEATPAPPSRPLRARPASEIADAFVDLAERRDFDALMALPLGRRKAFAVRDVLADTGRLHTFVDALLLGVRHENAKVRYECAHAMDIFGDERCVSALVELLGDPVPRVRRIAIHSMLCDDCKISPLQSAIPLARLKRPGDLAGTIVDMATSDPSIQVRRHAVGALALLADPRATKTLERMLARESDVTLKRNARGALRRVRGTEPR